MNREVRMALILVGGVLWVIGTTAIAKPERGEGLWGRAKAPVAPASHSWGANEVMEVNIDSVMHHWGFEDGWEGWTTVDITDPGIMWHRSEQHAYEGNSWWCADERIGGYQNHWLQYMMTPVLNLSGRQNIRLTFKVFWAVEDPGAGDPPPNPYDGWDGCNLWISTDGGENWQVLQPVRPRYTHNSLYSFGVEWNMGPNIPGWCAFSNGWQDAEFDLSNYARQNVRIRWAFASDPGLATPDDERLIGFLVDNIEIRAGNEVIWANNAEEEGDVEFDTGPVAGDYWELSQANRRSGRFSAHCPIRPNLQNALVSPPIDIPERGWYVWFDFWVLADTRMPDSDGDNLLDDYFRVEVSTDQVNWEMIIYDYGRDANWQNNWHYYGPDTTFRADFPEWKRKLNLTGFAGQRIWLRWVVRTDDVMDDPQGSGIWIDDVRINMTDRKTNDVGLYYLRVNYPTARGYGTRSVLAVRNFGMASQQRVAKYYRIESGPYNPIVPWDGIDPDSIKLYPFTIDPRRITAADTLTVWGITQLVNDEDRANDSIGVRNVVFYPQGIWVVGYDNRAYRYRYNLERGHGPAVYFTPEELRLPGAFDIKALRVWWNGEQGDGVQTRLHIYSDNGGRPGQEIHTQMVTVNRADVIPNVHVIDLSGVQSLRNLQNNFWVWFEILRDDHWPQIIGDDQKFGQGHYYDFDGQTLQEVRADWMVHAVLMPAGTSGRELTVGRDTIDFGRVVPNQPATLRVALFNGSTAPVTLRSVSWQGDQGFRLDPAFAMPLTLRIGDLAHLYITFQPPGEGSFRGEIGFQTDDETPPRVVVFGQGDWSASVERREDVPARFQLGTPYPNPFNARTIIPFTLNKPENVTFSLFDIKGGLVKELERGYYGAGNHQIILNGEEIPPGVYILKASIGNKDLSVKVALVK